MAAPLSDVVSLTITNDSVSVQRASFGVPMILSHTAAWAERTRTYTSLAEVADDFAIDTPEYLAARAMFSQNPSPESIKIGRAALAPTMTYSILATAANTTDYDIEVAGPGITSTDVTYTSDATGTVAEIHSGLVTALNAVVGNNYIAAFEALVFPDDTFTASGATLTAVAHGLLTGDGPFQLTTTGTLPAGLSLATDYWAIRLSDDDFSLATTLALALAGTAVTTTDAGSGTHTISDTASTARPSSAFTVTGDAAGDWFSLGSGSVALLAVTQTTADPGIATDLTAISVEDDNWYALYTLTNSKATVAATAGHIEAVRKIYVVDVCDTACATVAYTAELEDDVGAQQHTLARARTAIMFHPNPADMAGAAWIGAVLPFDPGSATWKFKTLSGVSPVTLTSTHRTNLRARKMNSYETIAGLNKTWEGTVASGEFIDITQGVDWIFDDMTKSLYEALATMPKVPFDDGGGALIENEIRGTLSRATDRTILARDPVFLVTVPRVANVSAANKSIRNFPDVRWSGTLAGAVHKVTINGVVSV